MTIPIRIPANSFIQSYESNEYDFIDPATEITIGWKNIDTGDVISIVYRNDILEHTQRLFGHIIRLQMEAQKLGPEACAERLREMAANRGK